MMKKRSVINVRLLFLLTGGTIDCAEGDCLSVNENAFEALMHEYDRRFGTPFTYETRRIMSILSENMTADALETLVGAVRSAQDEAFDGIIVTHGTDTLAFTSAALGYACTGKTPVCVVGANLPARCERSNALYNLHAAVLILQTGPRRGVWTPYKNCGESTKVHLGTRLLESAPYSDSFYSACDTYAFSIENGCLLANPRFKMRADEFAFGDMGSLADAAEKIVCVYPRPGLIYPQIGRSVRFVLLFSYHSGTVNTKRILPKDWFDMLRERGVSAFLAGARSDKLYESSLLLSELNITPVYNISPAAAYVKLWLCAACESEPQKYMRLSLSGDIFE